MTNCYVFSGIGSDNQAYTGAWCASNPQWGEAPPGYPGYFAPYDGATRLVGWATTAGSIVACFSQADITSAMAGKISYGNYCSSCINNPAPSQQYDCINGDCIKKTVYATPGLYQSLAACQAVCANGGACGAGKQCVDPTTFCPDGKVCIDQGEFSSIEALISKIGSEVC